MKKNYIATISFVLLVYISLPGFGQVNLLPNGDFSLSEVGAYPRGDHPNNPGWQPLYNVAGFEGLEPPRFFVTDEDALAGNKSFKIELDKLGNGGSHFLQLVTFTPEDEPVEVEDYYRVSLAIKPLTDKNAFTHVIITNMSFAARDRINLVELEAGKWNRLSLVYFNLEDERIRVSTHFNLSQNGDLLPGAFLIDDFQIIQSSLEFAEVTESGDELHAGFGWPVEAGELDPSAFTVKAGDANVEVSAAEVLEDNNTLKLNLATIVPADAEVTFSYDANAAGIEYLDLGEGSRTPPAPNVESFQGEFAVNKSAQDVTNTQDLQTNGPKIKLFPNPVGDAFQLSGLDQVSRIEIIAVTGQVISSHEVSGVSVKSFSTNELNRGIYFIRAFTGSDNTEIIKFIK